MSIKRRRRYDREFKEQAVLLLLNGEKCTKELAADLGIAENMLSRWKREYLAQLESGADGTPASKLEEENRRLRRELASLRAQRDVLKKALNIVSQTGYGESD